MRMRATPKAYAGVLERRSGTVWEAGAVGDLVIPAKLATTSVAWEGDHARAWLARLPALVAEVAGGWGLDVGPPLEPGGNISWVAPATRRVDGLRAVLKLQLPHLESAPEAVGLRAWDGDGAVRLHDHDPGRWALLIERCEPGSAIHDEDGTDAAVQAAASIGRRLHAVAPPAGLHALGDVLAPWADVTEAQLQRHPPADPGLARRALHTMRQGTGSTASPVLLHGDLNPTNVLAAEREPWLAIDPKPMVGDPAYDGPRVVMQPDPLRTDAPSGAIARRLDLVVEAMDLDRRALLEWCLVGAIERGASAWSQGETDVGQRCDEHVALLTPFLP
jgi:streptomycin 6-kinase